MSASGEIDLVRLACTLDPHSRTMFLRQWRLVRHGVRIVMQAFLKAAAAEASS